MVGVGGEMIRIKKKREWGVSNGEKRQAIAATPSCHLLLYIQHF